MSHAKVAAAALDLFARNGFDETTVDDIATALKISRRTLFRYFPSKNDIVWGDFDWVLDRLRHHLEERPPSEPLMDAITHAVIASNTYPLEQLPELRIRMTLITTVPALQAHSMVRYTAWRNVIAEFVARRLDQRPDSLVPLTIGHAALGTSMAAFSRWVEHPDETLDENLRCGYTLLAGGFDLPNGRPPETHRARSHERQTRRSRPTMP
jgi:mycofactocin system transcriptional regulator